MPTYFEFPKVQGHELDRIVWEMDHNGFGVLPDCIPSDELEKAANYIRALASKRHHEYFSCFGPGPVKDSLMERAGRSAHLRDALAGIYERGTARPAPASGVFQVLRFLTGITGLQHSNRFHYDAYVVTCLMPIIIPSEPGEARGDLVLYPNVRAIRSHALLNLGEKALVQNPLARRVLSAKRVQRMFKAKLVRMEPGSLYFFWGYRSLHANEACQPQSVRATALFHFADPHRGSPLVEFIERRHQRRRDAI